MKDIKIPGFLWVVLIAVAVVLCENYMPNPLYAEAAILVFMGLAKGLNLGTKEIENLVDLLRAMQVRPAGAVGPVGVERALRSAPVSPAVDVERYKPNKGVRWLLG